MYRTITTGPALIMEPAAESASARPPLLRLPQELYSDIIGYLGLNDRANLLRVCKSLYHLTYPYLWRTIDSNIYTLDRREISIFTLQIKNVSKLSEITQELGADALGFRHIKELRFGSGDFESYSPWVKMGLLDVICDQITSKKMEILKVKFNWEKFKQKDDDCVIKFLKILKNYSELNIKRPSIVAVQNGLALTFPFDLFALECFSSLKIGLNTSLSRTPPTEELVKDIEVLTKVLAGAVSLKHLRVEGNRFLNDSPCPIGQLQPQLSQLQDAITNLKQLNTLELALMLFHPSFFIVPPQNVKRLHLTPIVSVAWWRQFAQCLLPNVEKLVIYPHHMRRKYMGEAATWWSNTDPEANQADPGDFVFKLHNLAVESLRIFETDCYSYYCPEDFLELVVQRNPGLGERQRQKYLDMQREWKAHPRDFFLYGEKTRWDIDPRTGQIKQ
ncbi:hypothetical protein TWF751_001821 [Orbilia oligospora]|nr:hypothetical protein TWF751_001821 [Orbilia oligospora]